MLESVAKKKKVLALQQFCFPSCICFFLLDGVYYTVNLQEVEWGDVHTFILLPDRSTICQTCNQMHLQAVNFLTSKGCKTCFCESLLYA